MCFIVKLYLANQFRCEIIHVDETLVIPEEIFTSSPADKLQFINLATVTEFMCNM